MQIVKRTLQYVLALMALGGAIFISGCSTNNVEKQSVFQMVQQAWSISRDSEMSQTQVEQSPYALLKVVIENRPNAVMSLGYLEGDTQQWFSQDLASLKTQNGRITALYGLEGYANQTALFADSAFKRLAIESVGVNQRLELPLKLDLPSQHRFDVPVYVVIQAMGLETRERFNQKVNLLRVEEQVSIPSMDFTTVNIYWLDPKTRFIWESEQKWAPNLPKIYYQVLKPWMVIEEPTS
jgi:hypothetical protein